jgi:hypothetical protein
MIKITTEYDWEAAKLQVDKSLLDQKIGWTLRNENNDAEAAGKYLSTQYFDAIGMRYHHLEAISLEDIDLAIDFMISLMTVWLAQKEVYDEITANNAFEDYKLGNHDT